MMKQIFLTILVFLSCSSAGMAQSFVPAGEVLVFEILRNGGSFGTHRLDFKPQNDGTMQVDIAIDMRVGLGPIKLFKYEHRNTETWRGDQPLSMISATDDDGDAYRVVAQWRGNIVQVESQDDAYEAPAALIPTSYWNPVYLKMDQLLNTQKGHIEDVTITILPVEEMDIQGERRTVQPYDIDASVPIRIYHDVETQQWAGLDFDVRGNKISYKRLTPFD